MSDYELKKLTDLKVVELKHELEKRGLDKSGVKQFLIESLREVNPLFQRLFIPYILTLVFSP